MKYLIIHTVFNSNGRGYYIQAYGPDFCNPEIGFYDYSKRDAVRNYRQRFNLKGVHLLTVEY